MPTPLDSWVSSCHSGILPIFLATTTLRTLTPNDLPAFNAIYTDPKVRMYAEHVSAHPLTRFDLLTLRSKLELIVILDTATAELLGWCGLSPVQNSFPHFLEPEIFLKASAHGRGIGTTVFKELLTISSQLQCGLQARTHMANVISKALLAKLKFSRMGSNGDWETWISPS